MKTTPISNVSAIRTILLTFFVASFSSVLAVAQSQSSASELAPEIAEILSNSPPPPPGFATRLDYLKSFTNRADLEKAYRARTISKEEAMLATEMDKLSPEDKASMDTYGKVVDQNGEPIVGVKVWSHLEIGLGSYEEHDTKTDDQGQFHYLGLRGRGLIIHFQKPGYDFDERLLPERPKNYLPDPNNPLLIHMWKLHGPEPMKHIQIYSEVPRDGSIRQFDLLSNSQRNTGDLMVKLTRNPLTLTQSNRLKPFDWTVTFEIINGGFKEITNIYPYEAPAEGYQQAITLSFPTNKVGWQSNFKHAYYFNSQGGQVYGRMTIEVWAGGMTELAAFNAEIYTNPGGSRNLEFDSAKQIMR